MPQSRKLAKWKTFSLNVKSGKRRLKSHLEDESTPENRKGAVCLQGENTQQISKITFIAIL